MPRPTIFVSAVTRELKSARQLVANTLSFLGYEAVWQDIFGTEQGDLRAMLRRQIDECGGVVQLVGCRYGAEPPVPDEHFGRVSYTQYEALYAQQQGKKVWHLLMDENFPVDPLEAEPAELRDLQAAYRRRLQTDSRLFHSLTSPEALEISVLKLRHDLTRLRRGIKQWAAVVIALLLVLVAAVVVITRQNKDISQKLDQILLQGPAPAATQSDSSRPALAFAAFGLPQGATNWMRLAPERALRSHEHFFVRGETFTPGFLYLFQVDASGQLQWLFPANATCAYSIGTNPLPASAVVNLPPGSHDAFRLDSHVGEEHIYAVYCAHRWPQLELQLKNAASDTNAATALEIKTLLAAQSHLEEHAKGIERVEPVGSPKNVLQAISPTSELLSVPWSNDVLVAKGDWLLQIVGFQHLAADAN